MLLLGLREAETEELTDELGLREGETEELIELEGDTDALGEAEADGEAETEKLCIHIIQFSVVEPETLTYSNISPKTLPLG